MSQIMFSSFFIALVLLSTSHLAKSQEVVNEREFTYHEGSHNGPERWGEIHPEWSLCSNGNMQSPIDLLNERVEVVSHLGRLRREYRPSNSTLINRGHDIMLSWENNGGHLEINGTEYLLRQCHWHSPSEHTLNGIRFALEVHLVHESLDGRIAVFGIFYTIGRPDSFLSEMEEHLKAMITPGEEERVVGIIDPRHIKIGSRKYYRYVGSLTVPPCTQGVVWTMGRKVRTVSREQVKLLRDAVHDGYEANARPEQPINTRSLQLYTPRVAGQN